MNWIIQQFQYPTDADKLMQGAYEPWLVLLSVLIAVIASSIAYQVASQTAGITNKRRRHLSILAGSLAMGGGVWSMHFIGMLAFDMKMEVNYSVGLTLLSMLPSVLASWVALTQTIKKDIRNYQFVVGGVLVGAGIGVMHYVGMEAMQMATLVRYDLGVFALSIVVAVVLAMASLWIRFGISQIWGLKLKTGTLNLISGTVMGSAISGMHYTGMAATRFVKPESMMMEIHNSDASWVLAIVVSVTTLIIIFSSLAVSLILKYKDISLISQSNESRLQAIMDTAVDGIVTINSIGKVLGSNQAVEKILGWKSEDLLGQNVKCLTPEPHHSQHDDYLARYMATGEAKIIGIGREVEALHKDGRKIPIRLGIGHVQLPNESLFVAFIADISKRIEMEQDLIRAKTRAEQAATARAAFLANMSHEIRTPMNAIIGFSDVLRESELQEDQYRHVATIGSSARSLLHLLNDILDSAKLDKGKLEISNTDFSLTQVVDLVISTLTLQAGRKGLDLRMTLSPDLRDYYHGAQERIRQVLTNIIGNAIKFTEQGHVELDIRQDANGDILFTISDTGIGMNQEQLETIFEPFTQADASMSRRFGGTGLGTTISKQLVELMGGKIWASSKLNAGSTFSFSLPLKPGEKREYLDDDSDIKLPPLRILVVDDIEQNVELLSVLLKRRGHSIFTANNGEQAIQQWELERPDLILMDIQMPVMDGLSACRTIRTIEADKELPETPIIALTASVLVDDQLEARNAGMNGFATKPIELAIVSREIAKVLGIQLKPSHPSSDLIPRQLQTIDWDKGIKLWGDAATLTNEIHEYLEKWTSNKKALLVNALKSREFDIVLQESHSLKGLCGNLAMTSLSDQFRQLEEAVNSNQTEHAEVLMELIHISTKAAEIKLLKPEAEEEPKLNEEPAASGTLINADDYLKLVQHLIEVAKGNEHDEEALRSLTENSQPTQRAAVGHIAAAFNDFEFERAATLLSELQHELASEIN